MPGFEFRSVRDFARIVFFEPCLQIFCEANVKTLRHLDTLQNINVEKNHDWLACRAAARWSRPAFASDATARQPSPSAALRAKAGGAEGVRTPDPQNAILVLYQLSYDPIHCVGMFEENRSVRKVKVRQKARRAIEKGTVL